MEQEEFGKTCRSAAERGQYELDADDTDGTEVKSGACEQHVRANVFFEAGENVGGTSGDSPRRLTSNSRRFLMVGLRSKRAGPTLQTSLWMCSVFPYPLRFQQSSTG